MNRKPLDRAENIRAAAAPPNRTVGGMAASSERVREEGDYVNAPLSSVDQAAAAPAPRFPSCSQSLPPIALCWLILLAIMGLRVYFVSKLAAENQQLQTLMQHLNSSGDSSTLLAVIQDLRNLNNNLSSDNEHLRREINNLTVQLQTQRSNLTEQITNMETNWIDLNISRAQWSVEAYCPKEEGEERRCKACQHGWFNRSSCYRVNNPELSERKTWKEAQKHCRGKGSDLAVVHNQQERNLISDFSWNSSLRDGYWIGLRVEDGRWKWVDGSDLTASSWIEAPAEGRCAMAVQSRGWRSVSCGEKQRWICKMNALSV